MVLIIRGYDPTEIGLRKFLTEPEKEVLTCLWETEKTAAAPRRSRDAWTRRGLPHSNATIVKTSTG
jgi:hypothetical protein